MHVTIPNLPNIILEKSIIKPKSILEIGASNGADAAFLQRTFEIDPKQVYCIEPNPSNYQKLISNFPDFNSFHTAASNITEKQIFQCHIPAADISSFKKRIEYYMYNGDYIDNYYDIEIDVYRMDDFFAKYDIQTIDVCKVDVEGYTYEVLDGFGNRITDVNSWHIEGELKVLYENQKLFGDFQRLLESSGFTMVDYCQFDDDTQCDSIWIKNTLIK
jgi:FkbM family methyltransferase